MLGAWGRGQPPSVHHNHVRSLLKFHHDHIALSLRSIIMIRSAPFKVPRWFWRSIMFTSASFWNQKQMHRASCQRIFEPRQFFVSKWGKMKYEIYWLTCMAVSQSSSGSSIYPPPHPRDRDKSLPVPENHNNQSRTPFNFYFTKRKNSNWGIFSEAGRIKNRENPACCAVTSTGK